jgi:hypothetical protein
MHEPHPVSFVGTTAKQRGQRATNGLVISIRHCGQLRISSFNCWSSVVGINLKYQEQMTNKYESPKIILLIFIGCSVVYVAG